MRLTLVQPPNGFLDPYDLAPPLGLLSLAAVVREDGVEVTVLDLNLRGLRDPRWLISDGFWDAATSLIAGTAPDMVGFTSMAVESHLCLELARRVKAADPAVRTVLGGPHFSAIAREVLTLYDWIDYVVTGEGERALRDLVRHAGRDDGRLLNVAYRAGGTVELRRELRGNGSLDDLPMPAYDLVALPEYFSHNPLRLLNVDSSRGCIFRCSFCYSPGHWGQGEQPKSASRVAQNVTRMYELGARHLFFVQDNLLNSVPAAMELCAELMAANTGITWNAYATLQRLTPPNLDTLRAAGCTELFVGVDAVSSGSQLAFAKHFFKGWSSLKERLESCLDRGIVPTCAFMVDPPVGSTVDTDAALTTALYARNLGCGIRLNTLTVYNATGTSEQLAGVARTYTDLKPRLLLDTAPITHENPYARAHPELFPFHHTVLDLAVYERFVTAMHLAYTLFTSYPRTLLRYVVEDGGSLWRLLDETAHRVGDLGSVEVRRRRPLERHVFAEEFGQRHVSATTRDAFELEAAELSASLGPTAPNVRVRTEGGAGWYRPQPYEVVRLSAAPTELAREVPIEPPGHGDGRADYLVLRDGDQLRYFAVGGDVLDGLTEIRRAGRSDTVTMRSSVLTELTAAGVLNHVVEEEV